MVYHLYSLAQPLSPWLVKTSVEECKEEILETIAVLKDDGRILQEILETVAILKDDGRILQEILETVAVLNNHGRILQEILETVAVLNNHVRILQEILETVAVLNNHGRILQEILETVAVLNNHGRILQEILETVAVLNNHVRILQEILETVAVLNNHGRILQEILETVAVLNNHVRIWKEILENMAVLENIGHEYSQSSPLLELPNMARRVSHAIKQENTSFRLCGHCARAALHFPMMTRHLGSEKCLSSPPLTPHEYMARLYEHRPLLIIQAASALGVIARTFILAGCHCITAIVIHAWQGIYVSRLYYNRLEYMLFSS
ncbi:hypothetical protein J6590_006643 [Homalodisca vitripennis]|nr:hypothetical protein J6590_006643 [Homalodisca vitripennis]